ncbi:MAG: sterol desaturase family protein [Actinomycetota bacterium]
MATMRRWVPRLLATAIALWWLRTDPVTTVGIFGLTAMFFAAERLLGRSRRHGEADDLVHLTLTTWMVRIAGVELLVTGLRDLRPGWTVDQLPLVPRIVLVVVVFDLAGYAHHRLMHESTLLWPIHRIHHALPQVDVLAKARRHPLDDVFLIVFFGAVGFLLGADATSLRVVGVVATVHGMIVHANVIVRPSRVDRFLVTPWVHHRHHGIDGQHGDYAGLLTVWDRLFHTRGAGAPTRAGADGVPVGDWVDQLLHPARAAVGRRSEGAPQEDHPAVTGDQGPVTVGIV